MEEVHKYKLTVRDANSYTGDKRDVKTHTVGVGISLAGVPDRKSVV